MPQHHFTLEEVDQLIPTLERVFVEVLQMRASLRLVEGRLERAGVPLSRDLLDEDVAGQSREIRQAKAMFRGYYEVLAERLAEVGRLGGEVKDIEVGLVDFPSSRGGEDILLCWRLGEKQVRYWHGVEAGFSGRRPVEEPASSETQSAE